MGSRSAAPFLDEDALEKPHTQGADYPTGRGPALPANNSERVATLQKICKSTLAAPQDIDALLKAMSAALDCETVCVSLLTSTRTIISNGTGLMQPGMSFPTGVCHWSLVPQDAQTIIVEDMLEDERMCCHWLVGNCPTVRFYVASPLIAADQHRIGTLCLLDTKPRHFSPGEAAVLNNFSELVIRELEAAWVESTAAQQQLLRSAECYGQPYLVVDMAQERGHILYMSSSAQILTGAGQNAQGAISLADVFSLRDGKAGLQSEFQKQSQSTCVVKGVVCRQKGKDSMFVDVLFRPADSETVDDAALPIGIPSGTCSEVEAHDSMKLYIIFLKPAGYNHKHRSSVPIKGLRLGHLLGTGAFARVYRGLLDGMPVAVKIARDIRDSGTLDGTPTEAAIMSILDHPHIVRQITYTLAGASKGRPSYSEQTHLPEVRLWMVLEFCDKGNLESAMAKGVFLKQRRPDSDVTLRREPALDIVLHTALEIVQGMAYMHSQEVLHCDLSRANVLLKSSPSAKHGFTVRIADFGLSRMADDDQEPDNMTGTPMYKSPESLNSGTFSKASDVYAFGVLLWEMFMGRPAWDGLSSAQLAYAVLVDQQTLDIPEDAPVRLQELLRKMLGEADLRPPFADIVRSLEGCILALTVA
ncbi:g8560 [Coccomyxa viridis]|uniref:G8560 protein n=1 Tax=Coccomyxa viridis TaxID=1274662 RepID=A0ABP1G0N7_9CHLO